MRGIPGEFPTQRLVTRSFDVYFGLRLNKWLSKQSWDWRFETPSRPLWRHRNDKHVWDMWLSIRRKMLCLNDRQLAWKSKQKHFQFSNLDSVSRTILQTRQCFRQISTMQQFATKSGHMCTHVHNYVHSYVPNWFTKLFFMVQAADVVIVLRRLIWKCTMSWWRHQNIFRVTGPLCGEFTGHRWIPCTNASDAELWCSVWSAPE